MSIFFNFMGLNQTFFLPALQKQTDLFHKMSVSQSNKKKQEASQGRVLHIDISIYPVFFFVVVVFFFPRIVFKLRAPPERRLAKAAYLSHHAVIVVVIVIIVVISIGVI